MHPKRAFSDPSGTGSQHAAMKQSRHHLVLRDELALSCEPASGEDVHALSTQFNSYLNRLQPDPSKRNWMSLFDRIDTDGSRSISFDELSQAVRVSLNISSVRLPARQLKALFLALDHDASGGISTDEFGRFMAKAAPPPKPSGTARLQAQAEKSRAAKEEARLAAEREKTRRRSIRIELADEAPADEAAVSELSERLQRRFGEMARQGAAPAERGEGRSLFRLFQQVEDGSGGVVCYDEFERMMREKLGVGEGECTELQLKKLWLALDADADDSISVGEFASFIRLGEPKPWGEAGAPSAARRPRDEAGSTEGKMILTSEVRRAMEENARLDEQIAARVAARRSQLARREEAARQAARERAARVGAEMREAQEKHVLTAEERFAQSRRAIARLDDSLREKRKAIGGMTRETQRLLAVRKGQGPGVHRSRSEGVLGATRRAPASRLSAASSSSTLPAVAPPRRAQASKPPARPGVRRSASAAPAGAEGASAAAGEEMLRPFSQMFHQALARLPALWEGGGGSHRAWVKLWRQLEAENAGQINWAEFVRMVRDHLLIDADALPEAQLRRMWLSLGGSASGVATIEEFGDFMKIGAPKTSRAPARAPPASPMHRSSVNRLALSPLAAVTGGASGAREETQQADASQLDVGRLRKVLALKRQQRNQG